MTRCAVIGLGEAGSIYAAALLAAGNEVAGYDPAATETPGGMTHAGSAAEACGNADIVLVFTSASVAARVAAECMPVLSDGAVYADFTTSAPSVMRELEALAPRVRFADVAILGPVPAHGAATPLMMSGPGAPAAAGLLRALGAPVDVLDGRPGDAMAHKLLRSVVMKGLASVVVEAVSAGRAAGMEDWIREQISAQLAGNGQQVIDRFLIGTEKHAARRAQEMKDAGAYLETMSVPAEMTAASAAALARMASAARVS